MQPESNLPRFISRALDRLDEMSVAGALVTMVVLLNLVGWGVVIAVFFILRADIALGASILALLALVLVAALTSRKGDSS